jgi:hypothetical protein
METQRAAVTEAGNLTAVLTFASGVLPDTTWDLGFWVLGPPMPALRAEPLASCIQWFGLSRFAFRFGHAHVEAGLGWRRRSARR